MKRILLPILSLLLLSACSGDGRSLQAENENPLTASRYGDELADTLADLIIRGDPIVEESGMRERIQREIEDAKAIANRARGAMAEGKLAKWIPVAEDTGGLVAYVNDVLYFSSDFYTSPGLSLHVWMTGAVDPRDVEFPDESAVDLGEIKNLYGASAYEVPLRDEDAAHLRTAVLYDTRLKKIYAFVQF